ncbi:hypothetical protein PHLH7_23420 [Pseudomonas sp. Ost2]|nr:hypothetical protein PHLH7_23420 [Pseudomonas sp. Ost2]
MQPVTLCVTGHSFAGKPAPTARERSNERYQSAQVGEMVASRPIAIVSKRKPPRKSAILPISGLLNHRVAVQRKKSLGELCLEAPPEAGWQAYCRGESDLDTEAGSAEKYGSDGEGRCSGVSSRQINRVANGKARSPPVRACRQLRSSHTVWALQNSRTPKCDSSRPKPLFFTPPKATRGSEAL